MNMHRTSTYSVTTGSETPDGGSLDLEELAAQTQLLESQSTVTAHVPQDVRLRVQRSATHAQVLVEGGILPSGTMLAGVLSTVTAQP